MLEAISAYHPPAIKGKLIKIKYVTQLPTPTPSFVFFANLPQYVKEPYKRYLENKLRENFDFTGVPHFTIDTNYGIYIPDNTANATTSWGIYNLDRTYLEKGLTSNGSIAIVGGTSSQFLKADGSLDSSTYLTTDGTVTGAATQSQSFTNGITLNATSIVTDTTTGLIIGTGTTQKL